jgi:hypothetical protein
LKLTIEARIQRVIAEPVKRDLFGAVNSEVSAEAEHKN